MKDAKSILVTFSWTSLLSDSKVPIIAHEGVLNEVFEGGPTHFEDTSQTQNLNPLGPKSGQSQFSRSNINT